jgi:hypothetical protein
VTGSTIPMGKNANNIFWGGVIAVAAFAALASFRYGYSDGKFLPKHRREFAGAVAAALNPLVWLGVWAFNTRYGHFACPHCGRFFSRREVFTKVPAQGACKCYCDNTFLKPPLG